MSVTAKYSLELPAIGDALWNSKSNANFDLIEAAMHTFFPADIVEEDGVELAYGDVVYLTANGKWAKALADGTKIPALGLVVEISPNILVQRVGYFYKHDWSWSQSYWGKSIYLSDTEAGELTVTKPTNGYAEAMGVVFSENNIFILSDWDWK